jgi:hypothetical protein
MNPRCLFSVVVFLAVFAEGSAQAQGPVPGEPPALAVEGDLSLPDLHWTVPASQWEARAALGPSFAPTLTGALGGAPLAYLHDSASLAIGLTDRLQLSLATNGALGLSLRTGDREGILQGSATLAFTGFSTSNGALGSASMGFGIQGLASMDGGLQFLPSLWWVGSVSGHFGLIHDQRFAPLLRTGLSLRIHPRLRLQLGVEALVDLGVATEPLDGVQLAFGSVLQQGLRSFPLVEWQVHPSLSLDGYASVRFLPILGGALQTYLVGVTYTVR